MIELLEQRARQQYQAGTITRAEYARTVGRLQRAHALRAGLTAFCVAAAVLLVIGGVFA